MDLEALDELPLAMRWATLGAAGFGLVGGVVGLVVGLLAHPATAWFAIFELGVPAAILGGLIGLLAGAIAAIVTPRNDGHGGSAGGDRGGADRHQAETNRPNDNRRP